MVEEATLTHSFQLLMDKLVKLVLQERKETIQALGVLLETEVLKRLVQMPEEVPMTTQERAYTSPIWYSPGADPRS